MVLCPYCNKRSAGSRDHIFPKFLGGKQTIPACRQCNSTFGHTFEAAAQEPLKKFMLMFRRCGMKPPKPIIWEDVAFDDFGRRYDVDHDLKATLSKPRIIREEGKIKKIEGSAAQLKKIAHSLRSKGKKFRDPVISKIRYDIRSLQLTYPLDEHVRRLAIKMSVASALKLTQKLRISPNVRSYLLKGENDEFQAPVPVRVALQEYAGLDGQRPKLGHLVYVRASAKEKRCYSIVQLFGVIQFYCELATEAETIDFAALATHDPITHQERFIDIPPLEYELPPRHVSLNYWNTEWEARHERMRLELVGIYGDQAPEEVSVKPN